MSPSVIHERHMAHVDAVNEAKTTEAHWTAHCELNGFREGVRACGYPLGLMACDLEQFERGHTSREMCCGGIFGLGAS